MKVRNLVEEYPHITNIADPQGMYQLAQDYLRWMEVKNYSDKTIETREFFLFWFIEWCGLRNLIRPSDITKPIIERFQRYMFHYRKANGEQLSFRGQCNRLSAIRSWFKWLARENHILYNPASDIELPRIENRLPRAILSESEAENVLSQPDVNTAMGLRDRAIIEVLYSTGIRRLEVTRLTVQDLDAERGTLIVRQGKGKKDRVVPIGDRAAQWVDKYINETRPELSCGRDEGILFLNKYGEAIQANALTTLVRNYIKQANIGKSGSCHLFRHTMATLMMENGADIRFIQAMLGHVSLKTTEVYTHVSIKKLKEIHTLTHPAKAKRTKKIDWSDDEETEPTAEDILSALAAEESEEIKDKR